MNATVSKYLLIDIGYSQVEEDETNIRYMMLSERERGRERRMTR